MVELSLVAAGSRLYECLFNNKPDEHLDYNNIANVVFSHLLIDTIGLAEPQAKEQFGEDKVYKSSFTAMYSSVTRHRQPCRMKLVCVGEEGKSSAYTVLVLVWMRSCWASRWQL